MSTKNQILDKGGLVTESFSLWLQQKIWQIAILNFFSLCGKVQDSDLAHFLDDGKVL
jgi:hypothetical protein